MPDGNKPSDEEQCLIKEIEREIEKVKFFMEEIEIEMEIVNTEAVKIITKLSEFLSQTEELKMKWWLSPWMVRQWRKDITSKCAAFLSHNQRLRKCLDDREEKIMQRWEDLKWEQQLEDQQHFDMWRTTGTWVWVVEGKLEAELLVAEKKLEMEKAAVSSTTKLPKLKI